MKGTPSWDADESLTLYPTLQTLKHKKNEREALKEKKTKKQDNVKVQESMGFLGGPVVKNLPAN